MSLGKITGDLKGLRIPVGVPEGHKDNLEVKTGFEVKVLADKKFFIYAGLMAITALTGILALNFFSEESKSVNYSYSGSNTESWKLKVEKGDIFITLSSTVDRIYGNRSCFGKALTSDPKTSIDLEETGDQTVNSAIGHLRELSFGVKEGKTDTLKINGKRYKVNCIPSGYELISPIKLIPIDTSFVDRFRFDNSAT